MKPIVSTIGINNYQDIADAYIRTFKPSWWQLLLGRVIIALVDENYTSLHFDKLAEIIAIDQSDRQQYEAELFDCDDFALSLLGAMHRDRETAGMPIFFTGVNTPRGGHAVLSYYYQGEIYIIEPQNDEIFPVPQDWSLMIVLG